MCAVAVLAAPDWTLTPLVAKHDAVAGWTAQGSRDVFSALNAAVQFWIHGVWRHASAALIHLVAPLQERPALLARRVRVVFRTPDLVAAAESRLRLPLVVAALTFVAATLAIAEHAAANTLAPKPTGFDEKTIEDCNSAVDYEHAVSVEMGSESVAVSPGYGIQVRMRVNSMAAVVSVTDVITAVS